MNALGTVRWGVVSTANIGRHAVIPALHASHDSEVLAVGSRDQQRARAFALANEIPRAYGHYQGVLDDPEIDAVYIPLPNAMHREWTLKAIEAGKHVLCEKPLGRSAAECEEMAAAASARGVQLMEAFMYRFHPRTERVREMIREGVIGELRFIRSAFSFLLTRPDNIRWSAELAGGALMDVGCYCVNLSRTIANAEPVEAQAFATWAQSGVDERLIGTLRFSDGVVAQFDCSLAMERREHYELAGTSGALEVDRAFLPGLEAAVILERHGRADPVVHTLPGVDEYRGMVEHFADCVLSGVEPRFSAREAAQNMRTIEALYASARQDGTPVRL